MKCWFIQWAAACSIFMVSCKKEETQHPAPPEPSQFIQKIMLKDIIVPRLPSPYYHFEYGSDSLVSKAAFASGYYMYDVLYSGGRIREMRNNIIVNHDTLRYFYDNSGKVSEVDFIDQNSILNRHVIFNYSAAKVSQITWDHKVSGDQFVPYRILTFAYHANGNLKTMNDFRPAADGVEAIDFTTHYDDYDDMINVDDFTLIHDGIHDHFLLLPELHLQKNNARMEWVTGVAEEYAVSYKYSYNADHAPVLKSGELIFTSGNNAGEKFNVSTSYSYY